MDNINNKEFEADIKMFDIMLTHIDRMVKYIDSKNRMKSTHQMFMDFGYKRDSIISVRRCQDILRKYPNVQFHFVIDCLEYYTSCDNCTYVGELIYPVKYYTEKNFKHNIKTLDEIDINNSGGSVYVPNYKSFMTLRKNVGKFPNVKIYREKSHNKLLIK
ncbi:hypothetical protein PV-S19_0359 [Pacmanvirus S19]|nr:hypothetical protein PV-S19_0359 [Pacmanvirus S19]